MQEHHTKDLIACLKVELVAAARGAIVSRPVSDFTRYDRVLDWNGKLYRVQIKYVSVPACHAEGAVQLNLRKGANRCYSRDEIDALLVYAPTKNGQKTGCLMGESYLWSVDVSRDVA